MSAYFRCLLRKSLLGGEVVLILAIVLSARGQQTPTLKPQQAPRTAPQVKQILPSYEGQNVATVELAGHPELNVQQYVPLLVQQEGQPFSREKVDETMAALERTGKFQTVELQVWPEVNGVRLVFVLQPALYFGIYEFPGADRFPYSRLLQVTNYPPRGPYTEYDVQKARAALLAFFRRTGYFQAQVETQVLSDWQHGLTNVIFHTKLNRRAKFGNIDIVGPSAQQAAQLRGVLHSIVARLRNSAIRPGKTYKLKTLQNASQYLENTLSKEGHLAGQVRLIGASYHPDTNRADIRFEVQAGPIVHVNVQGTHLWPWTRRRLLPLLQQAGVNPELIQEGRQNLLSYVQSKGYFDAQVTSQVQQQPAGEVILYQVTKGPRHKVAEVSIAGNHHLSGEDLMDSVSVKEGHFLISHGKYSEQLARQSAKNLTNIYKAAGYSSVTVTPQVTTRSRNVVVTFRVNEGPQDIVQTLRIEGNNAVSPQQLAPKGLKIQPGNPYSQKAVDQDRTEITSHYLSMGYLTATFRATAEELPGQPHRLAVVYHIYEGPQVHTATVVTLGRRDTQPKLIRRDTAEILPGRPLREDDMLSSESELYTVGVFDWAEIDPRRQITTQTQEDVIVKLHESKRNQITYGGGFEVINRGGSVPSGTVAVPGLPPVGLPSSFKTSEKIFYGPRGTFEYTRKNLRGKGESITVGGLAGRLDQRGALTYSDPQFRWTNWSSNFTFSGEHNSENPIFTYRQGQFGWQLQRALNPDKTQNLFLRYNFSETGLTRLLIPDLVPPQDQHVRLSTVSATYLRDTRDNPLNAHKGIYESLEMDMNPSALGSNADFAKFQGQAAYYKDIGAGIIWANSLRIGLEQPFAGSHVPISEKFFSGGGSTLRGFPLNGGGPQRSIPACGTPGVASTCSFITVPVGGDELGILNSEFRFPLTALMNNLGFVTFYDGGNVFPSIGFHGQYTNSVGVGLRYNTPLGPIRFDIGHNLNAPPGIKSTQFFVTIGQAF